MNAFLLKALDSVRLPREWIRFRDNDALERWLHAMEGVEWSVIGASREGQRMYGLRFGNGPRAVSLIAGCHADEPIGPVTAQLLPCVIQDAFKPLLDAYTFYVVPQMNPDGADRNAIWYSDPPDIAQYVRHAVREQPGADIEFGFGDETARPENAAARDFLKPHAPFAAHFSLHGMTFAHGAWFLLCREWADRAGALMDGLEGYCKRMQFPLHDVDRKGEKGFNRLRQGFSTTPRCDAMQQFFRDKGDDATAALFKPTSMDMVQGWGGDPLCMVSEMPLFGVGKRNSSLTHPASHELKDAFHAIAHLEGAEFAVAVDNIAAQYELGPVSVQFQVRVQIAMIVLALDFLRERA